LKEKDWSASIVQNAKFKIKSISIFSMPITIFKKICTWSRKSQNPFCKERFSHARNMKAMSWTDIVKCVKNSFALIVWRIIMITTLRIMSQNMMKQQLNRKFKNKWFKLSHKTKSRLILLKSSKKLSKIKEKQIRMI